MKIRVKAARAWIKHQPSLCIWTTRSRGENSEETYILLIGKTHCCGARVVDRTFIIICGLPSRTTVFREYGNQIISGYRRKTGKLQFKISVADRQQDHAISCRSGNILSS